MEKSWEVKEVNEVGKMMSQSKRRTRGIQQQLVSYNEVYWKDWKGKEQ